MIHMVISIVNELFYHLLHFGQSPLDIMKRWQRKKFLADARELPIVQHHLEENHGDLENIG